MIEEYSQLHMNQDGVSQCTISQWNIMKQISGIITSIAEPWCTVNSEVWLWEHSPLSLASIVFWDLVDLLVNKFLLFLFFYQLWKFDW